MPKLLENNAYFQEYASYCHEYDEKKERHKAAARQIWEQYGGDSREYNDWCQKNPSPKNPYHTDRGASIAYSAWLSSLYWKESELDLSEALWEEDVEGFVNALKNAKLESFVFTCSSSFVMNNIHWFVQAECKLESVCSVTRMEHGKERVVQGIRFLLPKEEGIRFLMPKEWKREE